MAGGAARSDRAWWLGFLALGLAWRGLRYALGFPFWGDEAYLNINILHRGYLELLQPLEYAQIAPLLFLWVQRFLCELFGGGEYALRAFSLLAGVSALLVFARLAHDELPARGAALATGIFAASYYLVRHTCEAKPYAGDLAVSTLLLWATFRWLRAPHRAAAPVLATLIAGMGLWLSYPAIFVAGGVSLAMLPIVVRARNPQAWGLWAGYTIAVGVSFAAFYVLFVARHSAAAGGTWLEDYWRDSFPPLSDPLALLKWLVTVHTGRLAAHPVGGPGFGSVLTTLACVAGILTLVRARRPPVVFLLLAPFVLTLAAAALHKYPYGGSVRVSMHLAPAICLLAGTGAAAFIERLAAPRTREVAGGIVGVVLLVIPLGGMVKDPLVPYKSREDKEIRRVARELAAEFRADDRIAVVNPRYGTYGPPDGPKFDQTLRYYLVLYTGREPLWRDTGPLPPDADWVLAYQGPDFGPTPERVRELCGSPRRVPMHHRVDRFSDANGAGLTVYRAVEPGDE
ncbi:MAG: glycosyltransferase family 39 protein [Planctomycetota bacterium]